MAIGRRNEDDYSYTLDDEYAESSEYYDEYGDADEEQNEEAPSMARIIREKLSGIFKPARDKNAELEDEEDEEEEDDEEYERNVREEQEARRKASSSKSGKSSRRSKQKYEPENQGREYGDDEYTAEELNRYDEKFGTKGSS